MVEVEEEEKVAGAGAGTRGASWLALGSAARGIQRPFTIGQVSSGGGLVATTPHFLSDVSLRNHENLVHLPITSCKVGPSHIHLMSCHIMSQPCLRSSMCDKIYTAC